jgi:hypothetical protein
MVSRCGFVPLDVPELLVVISFLRGRALRLAKRDITYLTLRQRGSTAKGNSNERFAKEV